ncbi:MAG: EutN/CcmL family microcompartment protein [Candidatus Atribacteria bacterium]|nr:EutN/CcmL family microcompartment protein [Candidatus Atribacteria bacterium]
MILARVLGNVVSTVKLPVFQGMKIMIVQPLDGEGNPQGQTFLAFDTVQAGVGDVVLVIDEGNSARTILRNPQAPIRAVVVGIVDDIER